MEPNCQQLLICLFELEISYKSPTAKTAEIPTFRCQGNCNRHIVYKGRRNTKTSVMLFVMPDTKKAAPRSMHCPFRMVGIQIFILGTH